MTYAMNEVIDYVESKLEGCTVVVDSVTKANGVALPCLMIHHPERKVSPVIYLHDLEQHFAEEGCEDLAGKEEQIGETVVGIYLGNIENVMINNALDILKDTYEVMERSTLRIVSIEGNEAFLNTVPHIEFLDLAVYISIAVQKDQGGIASVTVTYNLLDHIGLEFEELYDKALDNMMGEVPRVEGIGSIISRIMPDLSEDQCEDLATGMYVVTNHEYLYGSYFLLHDRLLEKLANEMDSDLFVLPSSIHDLIVLRYLEGEWEHFRAMIEEINLTVVQPEEVLASHPYVYRRGIGLSIK